MRLPPRGDGRGAACRREATVMSRTNSRRFFGGTVRRRRFLHAGELRPSPAATARQAAPRHHGRSLKRGGTPRTPYRLGTSPSVRSVSSVAGWFFPWRGGLAIAPRRAVHRSPLARRGGRARVFGGGVYQHIDPSHEVDAIVFDATCGRRVPSSGAFLRRSR